MNDDAKFFFFLSGFFGFFFFYALSVLLNGDLIVSLVYGSCGSLFFSFLGRTLLLSALRSVQLKDGAPISPSNENEPDPSSADLEGDKKLIKTSMNANMEAASNKSQNLDILTKNR